MGGGGVIVTEGCTLVGDKEGRVQYVVTGLRIWVYRD